MHVAVAVQATQLSDFHAARLTELAKIVAQQVSDHDVFCAIFLGVEKRLCKCGVSLGVAMPGRRTLNGLRRDGALLNSQEAFRGE